MGFYVYILGSCRNGTLYIGMTDDLVRRVWEHQIGAVAGFTRKYGVKMLVWFERHESRESAFFSGAPAQEVEQILEARADRAVQSRLEGPRRRIDAVTNALILVGSPGFHPLVLRGSGGQALYEGTGSPLSRG